MNIFIKNSKGFTILELIVSLSIFAMMTSLVLSKYGSFNQGVLLTNLAYDVALSIRNAQSYSLNVRSSARNSNSFGGVYGVHFGKNSTKFTFFGDTIGAGGTEYSITYNMVYDEIATNPTEFLSETLIKRGSKIGNICVYSGSSCTTTDEFGVEITSVDISFKRPDPSAIIKVNGRSDSLLYSRVEITVVASDGTEKKVSVRSTGEISVI